ncbi:copper resistance protein NlpE [Sphingobacterium psychroaquaticum]|uniref:NlpE N-terminal domain-containing protein n=1 Tax=Sphingobacterium psychroaquaticum TaxID=561061 RepID=A0A1X7J2D6_9SPHI|nr:copper resistance protein NlpE [Sphingobacterium psychroaquaticum]QBQ40142.1 copper resistance protein NlpE [Sphingobacterium psychroaquaticum]SMG21725.1 NlpE N-terminal domain-containing protein [Sphingobacterium psychroaquaticum]
MRWIVSISVLFVLSGLFTACMNQHATSNTADTGKFGKVTESKVIGVYKGDLPCTDCEAIKTVLTLTENKEYVLEYIYVGKSQEAFSKSGKWELSNTELDLSDLDYRYKVEDKQLRQLDLSGKEIAGELADRYILRQLP